MDSHDIDGGLVQALLDEQHPDLAVLGLRPVIGGWDNQLWRLGDELAVRMPRTDRAPALLLKEQKWLPALASRLPLPVPTPVRAGEPSALFPKNWTIATWVPGVPADYSPMSDGVRAADALAGFLSALHQEGPADAPVSPHRGGPLAAVAGDLDDWLPEVAEVVGDGAEIREVWDQAVAAPAWQGPPLWLHADLHPANVVVADGTLAGVIDFGEVCVGDPAVDLAAAWLLLPDGSITRFLDAYASARMPVDEAMIRRARGWAASRALFLIAMGEAGEKGLPGGKPTWGPAGRSALERVLNFG